MPPGLAIAADGLVKHYKVASDSLGLRQLVVGGGRRTMESVCAIDDVSFDIGRSEVVGLVGRNGSGKSTLLRLLSGVYRPTAGTVKVRGRVVALLELGAGFDHRLTGRENVYLNASGHGFSRGEVEEVLAACRTTPAEASSERQKDGENGEHADPRGRARRALPIELNRFPPC